MAIDNTGGQSFKYISNVKLQFILNRIDDDIAVVPNASGNLSLYQMIDPYEDADQSDGSLIAEAIDAGYGEEYEWSYLGYIDFETEKFVSREEERQMYDNVEAL
jgi:hypothetical protein